jgi:adenosylhomocysteine nucleosidase
VIGILCGLKSEAKIADRIPGVMVGCCAGRPGRAHALARHMAEQGATRLISFGLAGGVCPDLAAGDLILGATIMASADAWEADYAFNRKLIDLFPNALCASIWGSERIAKTAAEKEMIYRRTACFDVDMESQVVAQTAHEYGLRFNAIRAIVDPYDFDLPPAALLPLKEDGGPDLAAIFRSVKAMPRQLPDLITLGLYSVRALRALRQVVDVMR